MTESGIKQVAIIGAGLMGFGIGVEYARFGYEVTLYNTRQESSRKAMQQCREALELMVETGLITKKDADTSYNRLHPTIVLDEALVGVGLVVESIRENLELKKEIFAKMDQLCPPNVIMATNTSSLRVSDIAAELTHPERVLATHYFQPPHFIPLVEVCGGQKTSPEVITKTVRILQAMHKKVAVVKMEINGFIGNRIQGAIARECMALVDKGVATPEMIDDVISFGFGRRMTYTGYFKRLDLIGLDFVYDSSGGYRGQAWSRIAEKFARGEYGMKTGKGFYDWTNESARALHRRQNLELIRFIKQDMDHGVI